MPTKYDRERKILLKKLLKNPRDLTTLLNLSHLERRMGKYSSALRKYESVLFLSPPDDPTWEIDALLGISATYRGMGNFPMAKAYLEEAGRRIRQARDWESLPFYYWLKGGIDRFSGKLKRAIRWYEKGFLWAEKLKDIEGKAYILAGMGGTYRVMGEYRKSYLSYRSAYTLFFSTNDLFGKAYTACGIGNAYRMMGRFLSAQPFYLQAVDLYEKLGDSVSIAYTYLALSILKKIQGKIPSARNYLKKAVTLFSRTYDERGKAYGKLQEWEISALMGDPPPPGRIAKEIQEWEKKGFHLEYLYGKLLYGILYDPDTIPRIHTSLKRAGSLFTPTSLPLNFP